MVCIVSSRTVTDLLSSFLRSTQEEETEIEVIEYTTTTTSKKSVVESQGATIVQTKGGGGATKVIETKSGGSISGGGGSASVTSTSVKSEKVVQMGSKTAEAEGEVRKVLCRCKQIHFCMYFVNESQFYLSRKNRALLYVRSAHKDY